MSTSYQNYTSISYQNYTGPISLLRSLGSQISSQPSPTELDLNDISPQPSPAEIDLNGISLDGVMNSFIGFKEVAYNNFYLLRLMLGNASNIQQQGRYDTVLRPIVELDYFNNKDYFWIESLPLTIEDNKIGMSYFKWQEYDQFSNMRMVDVHSINPIFYKSTSTSLKGNLYKIKTIFNKLLEQATSQQLFQITDILPFNGGLRVYIYTIFSNILTGPQHTKWAMIGSCINLQTYFPLSTINIESMNPQYVSLINSINSTIGLLQKTNWTDNNQYDNTWSFTSIADFDTSCSCIYSNNNSMYGNSSWINQLAKNCFVKDSTVDNPGRIYQMIIDLNQNYGRLGVGQIVLATYTYGNQYYISIIKMSNKTILNSLNIAPNLPVDCFKEKVIYVNSFFKPKLDVIGDTVLTGNLLVQTFDKNPIIQTDNVNYITTFHNKVGINQPSYSVKGLLDIANLSVSSVSELFDTFNINELNSCDIATLFASLLIEYQNGGIPKLAPALYNTFSILLSPTDFEKFITSLSSYNYNSIFIIPLITIPPVFQNISIFTTSISVNIKNTSANIRYYTSTGPFLSSSSPSLSPDSFNKVDKIVNEIYKMKSQNLFQPYLDANNNTYPIFSFTEILNDGTFYYLCSMRALFYTDPNFAPRTDGTPNALFFVVSSMNVHSIMINSSLAPTFNTIVNEISSTKRLINYSSLILYQPSIGLYTNSTTNLTTSSDICIAFTNYIQNSIYFGNRFGGDNIYVFCNELKQDTFSLVTIPYDTVTTYETILFNESNPQWSGSDSKNLYIKDDLLTSRSSYGIYKSLLNNFQSRKKIQFSINYKLNYDQKYSTCILFNVNGMTYVMGSSIDLEKIISKSIISNGDTLLSGDIKISDSNSNTIFQISNLEKKLISAYKVGVGKENPVTTMDINDTPMSSILQVIDKISNLLILLSTNISKVVSADLSTNESISSVIGNFTDTKNNSLVQNPFYYVSIYKINPKNIVNDQTIIYDWLFGSSQLPIQVWNNSSTILPDQIKNIPSSNQLSFVSSFLSSLLTKTFLFPNTISSNNVKWVYGKKNIFNYIFTNTLDDSMYCLVSGVDLQQYNLRYNTNDNIEKLFSCIDTYQSLLQTMMKPIPIVQDTEIPLAEYIQPMIMLKNNLSTYGNPTSIMQYKIYPKNLLESIVFVPISTPDYTIVTDTLQKMVVLFNTQIEFKPFNIESVSTIYSMENNNNLAMFQSLVTHVTTTFPNLIKDQSGMVWFEDLNEYLISLFYCTEVGQDDPNDSNTAFITITSIERKLEDFIIPTLSVKGDTRVMGEITTRIVNGTSNFSSVDPDNKFIGFNIDERQIFYTYLAQTFQKPLIYALNISYPTATFDRLFETKNYTITNGIYQNTDPNQLYNTCIFDSSTAIIAKRRSDLFLFRELIDLATSVYTQYGVDIAFELTDKWLETQRLGTIGMVIESVIDDSNTNLYTSDCYINAGFSVKATSIDASVEANLPSVTNKELLYISNDGNMRVKSIDASTQILENIETDILNVNNDTFRGSYFSHILLDTQISGATLTMPEETSVKRGTWVCFINTSESNSISICIPRPILLEAGSACKIISNGIKWYSSV